MKSARKAGKEGIAYIKATFNNTLISITDVRGDLLCQASAGGCGFKGARKSTPFAAQSVAEKVSLKAIEKGIREISIIVKGPGPARESAIRTLNKAFSDVQGRVVRLLDRTAVPHNGVRPRKKRRV
jgi:small subunit ribosomal protein S11